MPSAKIINIIIGNTILQYQYNDLLNFIPLPVSASFIKLSHPHPNLFVQ